MSITINFSPSVDEDISEVNVYEASASDGVFALVHTESITQASTSVTYPSGSVMLWYRITFVDTIGGESSPSVAIYGGGVDWATYMIPIVRTELDDWTVPFRISDDDMRKRLVVAASKLQMEMNMKDAQFDYQYTFTINNGDGSAWDITADPIYDSPDPDFIGLWTLTVTCSSVGAGLTKAAANAIKIKDGSSSIDTSAGFGGYKSLFEADGGACNQLKQQKTAYLFAKKQDQDGGNRVFSNFANDIYPFDIYIRKERS